MKPKFSPGDKVFAKVRGYPSWPARVEGSADESPARVKYHVYFYGTGETAVVKAEDICYFVENKTKLGKAKKHKNFKEALLQIEAELTPEQLEALAEAEKNDANNSSTPEPSTKRASTSAVPTTELTDPSPSSSYTDCNPPIPPPIKIPVGRRTSTASKAATALKVNTVPSPQVQPKPKPKEVKKRKLDIVDAPPSSTSESQLQPETLLTPIPDAEEPSSVPAPPQPASEVDEEDLEPVKRQRSSLPQPPSSEADSPTSNANKSMSDVTSRSGRRIKPKKFADFENSSAEEASSTAAKTPKPKILKPLDKPNEDFLVAHVNDEKVEIPLKVNKPHFSNSAQNAEWNEMVLKYATSLKNRLEKGEILNESVKEHMSNWAKEKAAILNGPKIKPSDEEDLRNRYFQVESRLLEIDIQIKSALSLKDANPLECLALLDQLKELKLTPLMLKKHPELVHTVKKLRRYIGNTICWSLSEQEMETFNSNAARIRAKADVIYNSFKSVFMLTSGESFWDYFTKELALFNRKTHDLTMEQVFSIIKDPVYD